MSKAVCALKDDVHNAEDILIECGKDLCMLQCENEDTEAWWLWHVAKARLELDAALKCLKEGTS